MARIRSIHPALFTDEAFAGLSMAARVLLLGLWTEADDQGVFDWKPITLKMRLMPVDNVDVPGLLIELEDADVIRGFMQDGKSFGAIRNFCKFQRPKTPKYRVLKSEEIRNYVASAYPVTETTEPEPEPFLQKVEMPPQMKEGGGREGGKVQERTPTPTAPSSSEAFKRFKAAYPKRDGSNPWQPAEKKFSALVKTGVDPEMMIRAVTELAREEGARGNIGTKFIPQAVTWLGQQRFHDYAAASFSSSSEIAGFYAKSDSPQLEAWDQHNLSSMGKRLPRDHRGGWLVSSEWPPGYAPSSSSEFEPVIPALRAMEAS